MLKPDWDKILWSWPVMLLNVISFVFMMCVFAEGCRETRAIEKQKERELRKSELKEIISEIKKDSTL